MKKLKTFGVLLSLLYISTIVHEAGHLLTALILGVPVKEIGLGGLPPALWETNLGETTIKINLLFFPFSGNTLIGGKNLLIIVNGPLATLTLSLVSLWLAFFLKEHCRCREFLLDLYFGNLGLGLFNLLPLPFLDGGQILNTYGLGWALIMLAAGLVLALLTMTLKTTLHPQPKKSGT